MAIVLTNECHENWDEMKPNADGRFCVHCSKTVIDFTSWSDEALYQFFSHRKNDVCGNFLATQLDRQLHIPNLPQQPHSRLYRLAIALGLTVMLVQAPAGNGFARTPFTNEVTTLVPGDETPAAHDTYTLNGKVLNGEQQPLTNAVIVVKQQNKQFVLTGVATDGAFTVNLPGKGAYQLTISCNGYTTLEKVVTCTNASINMGNLLLDRNPAFINPRESPNDKVLTPDKITRKGGGMSTTDLVALTPGIYQQRRGGPDVTVDGPRTSGNIYVIDSVVVEQKKKHSLFSWLKRKKKQG